MQQSQSAILARMQRTEAVLNQPQYVVGIGASAGGLEALEQFFEKMPAKTGLAFVVVQHLSPDFRSLMDELLARRTAIPIRRVEDGMAVEPDTVYLIPPKKEMIISGGKLLLTDKDPNQALTLPIDHFFRSLAQDVGEGAIGIVLSGTGSDGSRGIRAIHDAGGLVLVQSAETAKFDGMPKSAVETGVADFVLPVERNAGDPAALHSPSGSRRHRPAADRRFRPRNGDGNDLSPPPRPLWDRLQLLQAQHRGPTDRAAAPVESFARPQRLREATGREPRRTEPLYKDLLIGVTRFFRDHEAFQRLETEVLPGALAAIPPGRGVPGLGGGLRDGRRSLLAGNPVDGTDGGDAPPRESRRSLPPTSIGHRWSLPVRASIASAALAEVSPERVARHFLRKGDGYQVSQELRQMVVFAPHNIIKDAPFTKLDLISCRNLVIYFQPPAQKKAMSLFHFGLKTGGILFLGPSESPGELSDEFDHLDNHWKIYRKRRDVRLSADLRLPLSIADAGLRPTGIPPLPHLSQVDMHLVGVYDAILEEHMPPSLLVDENRALVQSFGGASRYLRLRDGRLSTDLLDMVDTDLRMALAGALQRAFKDAAPIVYKGLRVHLADGQRLVNLTVKPIRNRRSSRFYALVSIEELNQAVPPDATEINFRQASDEQLQGLETELRYTKENLQATIEELETSNEELQATNEELVASNEELQSTNEELHSVNEELYTVNAEYQKKIAELTELNADMDSLLASTEVHTVFLDRDLTIRKFTPKIAEVFNLLPQDVGRRIDNFTHHI